MLRFGIISNIDAAKGLARVSFEEDGIVSGWLPLVFPKAAGDSFSWMYDINEHVACLMDEHADNGVILGAIYSTANQPNGGNKDKFRVVFSDDTTIEYDRSAHKLFADVKGQVEVKAEGAVKVDGQSTVDVKATGNIKAETAADATVKAVLVTLDAPNVQCTGILSAAQISVTSSAGGDGSLTINGDMRVDGEIEADGEIRSNTDVKTDTISLRTHKHIGVTPGGGISGLPQ